MPGSDASQPGSDGSLHESDGFDVSHHVYDGGFMVNIEALQEIVGQYDMTLIAHNH